VKDLPPVRPPRGRHSISRKKFPLSKVLLPAVLAPVSRAYVGFKPYIKSGIKALSAHDENGQGGLPPAVFPSTAPRAGSKAIR